MFYSKLLITLLLLTLFCSGCGFKLRKETTQSHHATIIIGSNVDPAFKHYIKTKQKKKWQLSKKCDCKRCLVIHAIEEKYFDTPTEFSSYIHYQTIQLKITYSFINHQDTRILRPASFAVEETMSFNKATVLAEQSEIQKARYRLYEQLLDHLNSRYQIV